MMVTVLFTLLARTATTLTSMLPLLFDIRSCKAIVDTMKEYHADFKLENKKGIPAIEVILTADTIETLKQFSKPLNEKSHDEL